MLSRLNQFGRRVRLRSKGARVGKGFRSFDNFLSGNPSGFECGVGVYISNGSKICIGTHGEETGHLRIGDHVYLNHYAMIDCHDSINIGNSVLIGPFCYISDFDHGTDPDQLIGAQHQVVSAPVTIGDDVWLGAGAMILKGVTIGARAVIGANSVVTHDVPAGAVVAGNPVRVLRTR